MQCRADRDYTIRRASTARYWQPANDYGEIVSLDCAYCDFRVLRRFTPQPRTSTSGLGRYNRMRAAMVHHLHEMHRDKLDAPDIRAIERPEFRIYYDAQGREHAEY